MRFHFGTASTGGSQLVATEPPSEKQLPLWYTRDFNGREVICRQDDFAVSVEFQGRTFRIFHR